MNTNSPIYVKWNTNNGTPYSIMIENEQKQVASGQIVLDQIPDMFNRVQIDGMFEIKESQPITSADQFKCNYSLGILSFDSSKEGQFINVKKYFGLGVILLNSARVYTELDSNGNVVQTIGDIIEAGYQAIDNIATLNTLYTDVTNAVNRANTVADDFNTAEATRVSNETTRQTNESGRVSAESSRVSAENTRNSNETTRQNNEISRASAEQSRATEFGTWQNTIASVSDKIRIATFTATTNNTTSIVHNLTYNPASDDLLVIYEGLLLEKSIHYNENANNISIDLIDWSINTGEKMYFKGYKNVK